jgi:predicted dehydrogenase
MSNQEKLKVAVLGCSPGPGEKHLLAWSKVDQAEVVLLAEKNSSWAREMAEKYSIPEVCDDFREAIGKDGIDIVDVALPIRFHAEASISALEAGCHVVCEKPMTATVEEADRVVEAVKRTGRIFAVNFQRRFVTPFKKAGELVQEGTIGRPVHWRMILADGSKDRAPNIGYPGIIEDCGIHDFDFASTVFGRPVKVQAIGMKLSHRSNLGDYDTGTAVVIYEHGDQMAVHMCNGMLRGQKGSNANDILGPQGVIHIDPLADGTVFDNSRIQWTDEKMKVHTVAIEDWSNWNVYRGYLFEHVAKRVLGCNGEPCDLCDAEQGRRMVILGNAIRQALDTGKTVELEEVFAKL